MISVTTQGHTPWPWNMQGIITRVLCLEKIPFENKYFKNK